MFGRLCEFYGKRCSRFLSGPFTPRMGGGILNRGSSIFYGTVLLTGSNLLLRLVSMGFQVYLSRRIGAAGIGLLQLIVSVQLLFFTVGAAGIRTSTVYLCAEALGRRRPQALKAVMKACFPYSFVFSGLSALGLWYAAPMLCQVWIGTSEALPALRACALFLPVRCLGSVISGCFTAAGRIRPLILLDFAEQACSIAVTFFLLSRWEGAGLSCLAVSLGGCAGSVLSFAVLLALYRAAVPAGACPRPPYGRVLRMSLPFGLADTLRSGLNTLENLIIPRRLALFAGTAQAMADYGVVRGMAFPVLMFPAAILFSLAELLVPELSRCAAGRRHVRVSYLARRSLRLALLFGLCAGGLIFSLADALGLLLYQNAQAGSCLRLYAPFLPLLYTDIVTDAICKGLGQQNANARYNIFTSVLDVAVLWALLPRMGMGGYYFSFLLTHLVNFLLSFRRLMLVTRLRPTASLPLRAVFSAAAAVFVTGLFPVQATVSGLVLSGATYLLLLFFFWSLFRVVGRSSFSWLLGLVRSSFAAGGRRF